MPAKTSTMEAANARFERLKLGTRLEALGELDNTILVVSGDNGMPFPRCKATLYDTGTHVPLIIYAPGMTKHGEQDVLVNMSDLLPTIAAAMPR